MSKPRISPALAFAIASILAQLASQQVAVAQDASAIEEDAPAPGSPFTATVSGQVFASFDRVTISSERFTAFRLPRAEVGVRLTREDRSGFMLDVESLRSAGERSYTGIDDNSLVLRVKRAFGHHRVDLGPVSVGLRGGLIPDLWVEALERAYDTRAIAPTLAEAARFYDTSDLGASLRVTGWSGLVSLGVALQNGEGRNQVELNRGKNTTVALTLEPLALLAAGRDHTLAIHGSYRDGSVGTSSRANHRTSAAITYSHMRASAGVEYSMARGYLGVGALEARGVAGWASAALYPSWLGAYGRISRTNPDLTYPKDRVLTVQAGLYADMWPSPPPSTSPTAALDRAMAPRLRLYVGYGREDYSAALESVPGVNGSSDAHSVRAILTARGLASFLAGSP